MIGDPLKKVTTGQPFVPSAASWNAFADAARAHLEKQVSNYKPYLSVGGNGQTLALVQNTGSGVGRFGILSITGTVFDPTATATLPDFQNCIALQCGTFDASKPFVITLEPIAANAWGMVVVSGVVPAQINVNSTTDKWVDVSSVFVGLQSCKAGAAEILWAASGTGQQWAIIRLGGNRTRTFAQVVTAYQGCITAHPYNPTTGTADTSVTLTLCCRFTSNSGSATRGAFMPNVIVGEVVEYEGAGLAYNAWEAGNIDGWIKGDVLLPVKDAHNQTIDWQYATQAGMSIVLAYGTAVGGSGVSYSLAADYPRFH
jgi:hypothetical protein